MKLAEVEGAKLGPLLESVAGSIEDLLLGGLTTASQGTISVLQLSFQEVARARLLRLGICLRTASEELIHYRQGRSEFSGRRLHAHLTRAWLLARAIQKAIRNRDEVAFERLVWSAPEARCDRLEVVAMGVIPRVVPDSHYGFDFRLRVTRSRSDTVIPGQPLVWSCVTALKPSAEVPVEAVLFMPQKPGFAPAIFLQGSSVAIENCAVALGSFGVGRVAMDDKSRVTAGTAFGHWPSLARWDPGQALKRLESYRPSPLDLEGDPQEEVVLEGWTPEALQEVEDGCRVLTLGYRGSTFQTVALREPQARTLCDALERMKDGKPIPPLFGLMHYERCRLVVHPVSVIGPDGPVPLLLDPSKLDRKLLVKAFHFS